VIVVVIDFRVSFLVDASGKLLNGPRATPQVGLVSPNHPPHVDPKDSKDPKDSRDKDGKTSYGGVRSLERKQLPPPDHLLTDSGQYLPWTITQMNPRKGYLHNECSLLPPVLLL
jgi:hypothetical protein